MNKAILIQQLKTSLDGGQDTALDTAMLLVWLRKYIPFSTDARRFMNGYAHGAALLSDDMQETFNARLKEELNFADIEAFFSDMATRGAEKIVLTESQQAENLYAIYQAVSQDKMTLGTLYRIVMQYEAQDKTLQFVRDSIVHPNGKTEKDLYQLVKGVAWDKKIEAIVDQKPEVEEYQAFAKRKEALQAAIQKRQKDYGAYANTLEAVERLTPWEQLSLSEKEEVLTWDYKSLNKALNATEAGLDDVVKAQIVVSLEKPISNDQVKQIIAFSKQWGKLLPDKALDANIIKLFRQQPEGIDSEKTLISVLFAIAKQSDYVFNAISQQVSKYFNTKKGKGLFNSLFDQNMHVQSAVKKELTSFEDLVASDFLAGLLQHKNGAFLLMVVCEQWPEGERYKVADSLFEYAIFLKTDIDVDRLVREIAKSIGESELFCKNRFLSGASMGELSVTMRGGNFSAMFSPYWFFYWIRSGASLAFNRVNNKHVSFLSPIARLIEHMLSGEIEKGDKNSAALMYIMENMYPESLEDYDERTHMISESRLLTSGVGNRKSFIMPSHLCVLFNGVGKAERLRYAFVSVFAPLSTYFSRHQLFQRYLALRYDPALLKGLLGAHNKDFLESSDSMSQSLDRVVIGGKVMIDSMIDIIDGVISPVTGDLKLGLTLFYQKILDYKKPLHECSTRVYIWFLRLCRLHTVEVRNIVERYKENVSMLCSCLSILFSSQLTELDMLVHFSGTSEFVFEHHKAYLIKEVGGRVTEQIRQVLRMLPLDPFSDVEVHPGHCCEDARYTMLVNRPDLAGLSQDMKEKLRKASYAVSSASKVQDLSENPKQLSELYYQTTGKGKPSFLTQEVSSGALRTVTRRLGRR